MFLDEYYSVLYCMLVDISDDTLMRFEINFESKPKLHYLMTRGHTYTNFFHFKLTYKIPIYRCRSRIFVRVIFINLWKKYR